MTQGPEGVNPGLGAYQQTFTVKTGDIQKEVTFDSSLFENGVLGNVANAQLTKVEGEDLTFEIFDDNGQKYYIKASDANQNGTIEADEAELKTIVNQQEDGQYTANRHYLKSDGENPARMDEMVWNPETQSYTLVARIVDYNGQTERIFTEASGQIPEGATSCVEYGELIDNAWHATSKTVTYVQENDDGSSITGYAKYDTEGNSIGTDKVITNADGSSAVEFYDANGFLTQKSETYPNSQVSSLDTFYENGVKRSSVAHMADKDIATYFEDDGETVQAQVIKNSDGSSLTQFTENGRVKQKIEADGQGNEFKTYYAEDGTTKVKTSETDSQGNTVEKEYSGDDVIKTTTTRKNDENTVYQIWDGEEIAGRLASEVIEQANGNRVENYYLEDGTYQHKEINGNNTAVSYYDSVDSKFPSSKEVTSDGITTTEFYQPNSDKITQRVVTDGKTQKTDFYNEYGRLYSTVTIDAHGRKITQFH
ncbi:hypothetical protein IJ670_02245 [bacterium]|nr:hypothetical protein [bacterium]